MRMGNKLFILGWDNGLIQDVVRTKIHTSYIEMLRATSPILAAKWTIKDTYRMQGMSPTKIWYDFALVLGEDKVAKAKEVFYKTYENTPGPELVANAYSFLQKLHDCGYYSVVVSNKSQRLLGQEMADLKVRDLVSYFVGSSDEYSQQRYAKQTKFDARYELLSQVLSSMPNIEDAVVVAHKGYAEPAYVLGVPRFEEASSQVFDWLSGELQKQEESFSSGWDREDFL